MSESPLALFVGEWLPYSETFVYDQVRHQARFVAHAFAKGLSPVAARFPYPHVHALALPERLLYLGFGRSPTFERAIDALRPKVVHAHFGLNGVLAAPFARRAGAPLVVTFHGHDVSGLFPQNRFTLRYGRYQLHADAMLAQASLLLCASQELADLLAQRSPESARKLVVHRLGIELARFAACAAVRPDGPLRVVMIGRMVEKKGMAYGISAFARLCAEQVGEGAELVIAGDGPLRASLEAQARALGLGDRVRFAGVVDAARVPELLASAHVLLAPSVVARDGDRESGVIVLKEAGAARLPAIGTRHGGIPEIIDDGVTGFLVPERDAAALADKLILLSSDRKLCEAMGAAAYAKIAREYDSAAQNARLEQHFASVL